LADPGETVGLRLVIRNRGRGAAPGTACSLSTSDASLILLDTAGIAGTIPAGAETSLVFRVQVSPGASSPHIGLLRLRLSSILGPAFIDSLPLVVGRAGLVDPMDNDSGGWTHGGSGDLWHITNYRSHREQNSWYCGQDSTHYYVRNSNAWLLSPSFMLGPDTRLSFWRRYELPVYGTDGLFTEIFYQGRWDTLGLTASGGALGQLLGLTGDWAQETYDLSGYGYGDTARVRFTFVSDGSDSAEGFYLDDLQVSSFGSLEPGFSLDLISPNGGEVWSGTKEIRWHMDSSAVGSLAAEYSHDGGLRWKTIAVLNEGSPELKAARYSWNTVPAPNDTGYRLRLSLFRGADTVSDVSLGTFALTNPHDAAISSGHLAGGANTVSLNPYITDPSLLNGHSYQLRFGEILRDTLSDNSYTPVYSFDLWDATASTLLAQGVSFSCPQTGSRFLWAPDPFGGVVPELTLSVNHSTFSPGSFKIKSDINLSRPPSADTLRANANIDQCWPWRSADYDITWRVQSGGADTLDTLWAEVWDATNRVTVPLDTTCGWGSMRKSAWAIGPTASAKGAGWVAYGWPDAVNSYLYLCGSRFYFNRSVIPRKMTWATRPEAGEVWSVSTSGERPPHDGDIYGYTASKAAADTGGPSHGLFQNRPNPFSGTAVIFYRLSRVTRVRIKVYNIAGQKVATLVDEVQTPGLHTVSWKGRDEKGRVASTGFYFYRMETDDFIQTKKMLLLK
ncbi:MAG: T9SS type A sorting domain-containing protein, partial [Desulfobacterales bacterium]|nr:T9SS type A sorting domain-containing protein [Desulfobacterales bacterium]